ncbi:T9SS type A sorting domain-containing protein [Bacteroidota bacterium]
MKFIYLFSIFLILSFSVCFSQWEPANNGIEDLTIYKIIGNDEILFALAEERGLLISSDYGTSWTIPGVGYAKWQCYNCLTSVGDTIFCGNNYGGEDLIFWSKTNDLQNWQPIKYPGIQRHLTAFTLEDNSIYIATELIGLAITTDLGENWELKSYPNPNLPEGQWVEDILIFGNRIFISIFNHDGSPEQRGIYYSDDNFETFNKAEISGNYSKSHILFACNKGVLYASSQGYGYNSLDSGATWDPFFISDEELPFASAFTFNDSLSIVAGTYYGYIAFSYDNGSNWIIKDKKWNIAPVPKCLAILDGYLFVGTDNGVYRARLDELTDIIDNQPGAYSIKIIPNPFSEKTKIKFSLTNPCRVKLSIYNTLGYKIAIIEDSYMNSGMHESVFDGTSFSSGAYYYVLQAGERIESGKMVLMK